MTVYFFGKRFVIVILRLVIGEWLAYKTISEGKFAKGVGSPHTPEGYIWHIALSMQGLTSDSPEEIREILHMLETTDGGTGYMHEGFDANDPDTFTRSWFSWSCALFSELVEKAVNEGVIGNV